MGAVFVCTVRDTAAVHLHVVANDSSTSGKNDSLSQVFAALLHLMPQVGRQVSGGQITAPTSSQTHQSLVSQQAKLVLRQEQLLHYQQRLLLSQGNAAGRIPIPPGVAPLALHLVKPDTPTASHAHRLHCGSAC